MDPFMQESMMANTGMPTLGRRAKGFGSSPFGPSGPIPVHQMNFLLGGMGRHGMLNTPYGAGRYPNPQPPFPLGYAASPMMPPHMTGMGMGMGMGMPPCMPGRMGGLPPGMMGMGMMGGGAPGMGMGGGGMGYGAGGLPPWMMGMADGGMGMGMSPGMGLLDGLEDADDTGVWDGDEDGDGMSAFDGYMRAVRKARRKGRGVCGGMPGMPLGAGAGMCMPVMMPGIGCY